MIFGRDPFDDLRVRHPQLTIRHRQKPDPRHSFFQTAFQNAVLTSFFEKFIQRRTVAVLVLLIALVVHRNTQKTYQRTRLGARMEKERRATGMLSFGVTSLERGVSVYRLMSTTSSGRSRWGRVSPGPNSRRSVPTDTRSERVLPAEGAAEAVPVPERRWEPEQASLWAAWVPDAEPHGGGVPASGPERDCDGIRAEVREGHCVPVPEVHVRGLCFRVVLPSLEERVWRLYRFWRFWLRPLPGRLRMRPPAELPGSCSC